jgi:hypothetical protein
MRSALGWSLLLCLAGSCRREPATLICNNANCVPPVDVRRDDTMEALRESLDLEWHGRPAFDGVEIDTVWDVEASRCLFTYLYDTATGAFDATAAAAEIADHLRETAEVSANRRFYFKIQSKVRVAPAGRDPTQPEAEAHMDCALEVAGIVEAAASEVGRPLTVLFGEDPVQLSILTSRPGWQPPSGLAPGSTRQLVYKLEEAPVGGLRPDAVSIEAGVIDPEQYATVREIQDRGIEVQLWSRHLSVEIMAAIDAIEPSIFVTNDILSARLWLGPTPEDR